MGTAAISGISFRVDLLDGFLKLLVQAFFALDEAQPFFSCLDPVLPPVRALYRANDLDTGCEPLLHQGPCYFLDIFFFPGCREDLDIFFHFGSPRFLSSVWLREALESVAGHSLVFRARFSNKQGNVFQWGSLWNCHTGLSFHAAADDSKGSNRQRVC